VIIRDFDRIALLCCPLTLAGDRLDCWAVGLFGAAAILSSVSTFLVRFLTRLFPPLSLLVGSYRRMIKPGDWRLWWLAAFLCYLGTVQIANSFVPSKFLVREPLLDHISLKREG
jgi:hypothetical protein